ncbi:MAG: spore gernimation protein [Gottschalkiaceae bacterium]|nr:MAG: spore gernimation protein [Gottschalkiaceae bacterium]
MERFRISSKQFSIIVAVFTIGTTILVTPGVVANRAKQDSWMVPLIGIGVGVLIILLHTSIAKLYPQKNFFETILYIFGKWLGTAVNIFLVIIFIITASQTIWYLGNFLKIQVLTEVPIYAIHIIYTVVVIYGARLGLETISRSAQFLFPTIIFLFILVTILIAPQSKLENLQPIFEYGLKPILSAAVVQISILCLPLIILLMIPSDWVEPATNYRKSFITGYIMGGAVMFITTLFCILVLGHKITAQSEFPTYLLAKKVNVLNFFQRMEPIIAIMWMISIFYRTSLYMNAALIGIYNVFNLKDYKYIVTPLGIFVLGLSLIAFPDTAYQYEWDSLTWISIVMTFGLLLPLLLIILGLLKKKKQSA